jgi:coproporphyrinogen III oxidase-like Fe-S oxidoreductase
MSDVRATIAECITTGLIEPCGEKESVRLTRRGRLLSNEVFENFLLMDKVVS